MSAQDYSQRDQNIRHNVYASVRKRDGLPRELFANYWRDVHETLCSRLPGLGFYVQQHFDRNHTANLFPVADGVRRIAVVLDGSAELGFASVEDQEQFGKASTILYADERNVFSEAIAYQLPTGSRTFVDREADGIRNGPDRLHRLHVYMNRKSGPDAAHWLEDVSAALAADAAVQKWKLHLPQPYDNEKPAPPSPGVDHHVENDRLHLTVLESPLKMLGRLMISSAPAVSKSYSAGNLNISTPSGRTSSAASTHSFATARQPRQVCGEAGLPNSLTALALRTSWKPQ